MDRSNLIKSVNFTRFISIIPASRNLSSASSSTPHRQQITFAPQFITGSTTSSNSFARASRNSLKCDGSENFTLISSAPSVCPALLRSLAPVPVFSSFRPFILGSLCSIGKSSSAIRAFSISVGSASSTSRSITTPSKKVVSCTLLPLFVSITISSTSMGSLSSLSRSRFMLSTTVSTNLSPSPKSPFFNAVFATFRKTASLPLPLTSTGDAISDKTAFTTSSAISYPFITLF